MSYDDSTGHHTDHDLVGETATDPANRTNRVHVARSSSTPEERVFEQLDRAQLDFGL
jgi:hypothetical protein